MKRSACATIAFLASLFPALAGSPQSQGFQKLSDKNITKAFAGKTFTDETHFSFDYRRDGTIGGTSMGRKVANRWVINNGALCVTNPAGETCYTVWKKGNTIRLGLGESDITIDGILK